MPQGAALQHAELVEQKQRVVTAAVKMPVPGRAFLFAMGRADRTVHVQHDILQPIAVMKAGDPLAARVGRRRPVLGQGQRPGLEPSHLRCRGCLRIDNTVTDHLTHDGIEGETVSVFDILVPRQPPVDRLPEQPIEPVNGVFASAAVAQGTTGEIRQPERVIQLAHHQQVTVGTELRSPEFKPHPLGDP